MRTGLHFYIHVLLLLSERRYLKAGVYLVACDHRDIFVRKFMRMIFRHSSCAMEPLDFIEANLRNLSSAEAGQDDFLDCRLILIFPDMEGVTGSIPVVPTIAPDCPRSQVLSRR